MASQRKAPQLAPEAKPETSALAKAESGGGKVAKTKTRRTKKQRIKPVAVETPETETFNDRDEQSALVAKGELMGRATIEPIKHGFQRGQAQALGELSDLVNESLEMVSGTLDDYLTANYSPYLTSADDLKND